MSSLALALAIAVCGARAPAQGEFGGKGDIIISVDRLLPFLDYQSQEITTKGANVTNTQSVSQSSFSFLWGGSSGLTSGWLVPFNTPRIGADYVVVDRVTVGGELAYYSSLGGETENKTETAGQVTTTKADLPDISGFGLAVRGGYVLSLGKGLSFWPRAGVSFYSGSATTETPGVGGLPSVTEETSFNQTALNIEALATYQPVANVVLTAGPVLDLPIDGRYEESTKVGGTTTTSKSDFSTLHVGLTIGLAFYL